MIQPVSVSVNLLVECKKLVNEAVVIFGMDKKVVTYYDFHGQMQEFPDIIEKRQRTGNPLKEFDLGWFLGHDVGFHYQKLAGDIGVSARDENDKPPKEEEDELVYDGMMKLVKAQSYEVGQNIMRQKELAHGYYPLFFTFLTLVIDGMIVYSKNGIEPKQIQHGIASIGNRPNYYGEVMGALD